MQHPASCGNSLVQGNLDDADAVGSCSNEWIVLPHSQALHRFQKGNDISTLQVQNGTQIGFPAFRAIFHFCNIDTPFLVYGVGCEFSVQNILSRYFRLRPLICRTFSADDSKQADNMYQTIESIQVQNVTSLGYCIPLFVHFPNTNVEIFLSYSAQRHLISSSSSFFSTAFSVFNLLFRASSIRFSARSFSASVISDSALRLPRLSTRPSMPFSLYFLTQK